MQIDFTDTEMQGFLQKRGYRIAKHPVKIDTSIGPIPKETDDTVIIAIKGSDMPALENLYWKHDIEKQFGLKARFKMELKKAILRL